MEKHISRRKLLELVAGGMLFAQPAFGSVFDSLRQRGINPDSGKNVNDPINRIINPKDIDSNQQITKTKMVFLYDGDICFKEHNLDKDSTYTRLFKGDLAKWSSQSSIDYKVSRNNNRVYFINLYSGAQGIRTNLSSFPVVSPDGKNFLQVVDGEIFLKKDGKDSFRKVTRGGHSPKWKDNKWFFYISNLRELKLYDSEILKYSEQRFTENCTGYDLHNGNLVFTEAIELSDNEGINRLGADPDSLIMVSNLCVLDIDSARDSTDYIARTLHNQETTNFQSQKSGLERLVSPRISPNGKNVALVKTYGNTNKNSYNQSMDVLVYDLNSEGNEPIRIISGLENARDNPYENMVSWLNDSQTLAIENNVNNKNQVLVFDINSGESYSFPGRDVSVLRE